MLGDGGQRRAVILRDIAVGADIVEQCIHRAAGQVDSVARLHIAALGVAGGGVLQYLGAVQELPALLLAHFHQGLVVLVHLGLGQALVGVLLPDGRDGVDEDIHAGVGRNNGLDARLIILDEIRCFVAGIQVVGAKSQNDPAGLQFCHRLGHCHIA